MNMYALRLVAIQGLVLLCLLVPSLSFAQTTTSSTAGNTAFVSLTQFPQIQALSESSNFATFINTFYKILIGVGSALAVIMIMIAGVQFMTSRGSVTSNEKAKSRIQNAIFGLILLLSPVIVFTIINPSILKLNLGTEFGSLKQNTINQGAFSSPLQAQQCNSAQQRVAVPVASGQTSVSACTAKGTGWAQYDDECCSVTDPTKYACCGYDPANQGGTTTPANPDNGTGTFYYDYVQQDTDYDSGAACTTGVQSRRFPTAAECNASAATMQSNTAIRNKCSSTETYNPSQARFNQISSLPTCAP
jgi:hypothetical protein